MNTIEGIIINISEYKNNDQIINVLTNDSFIGLTCRGTKKISNKNNGYIKPLNYGYFTIYKGPTKYFKLSSIELILDVNEFFGNLEYMLYLDFVEELTFKLLINNCANYEYTYKALISLLLDLKSFNLPRINVTKYFYSMLLYNGILNKDLLNLKFNDLFFKNKVSDILDGEIEFNQDFTKNEFSKIISELSILLKKYLDISLNSVQNII